MRPAKIQISIRAVWSESLSGAFWTTKDAKFSSCGQRKLRCADAQADFESLLAHRSEGTFSHVAINISLHFISRNNFYQSKSKNWELGIMPVLNYYKNNVSRSMNMWTEQNMYILYVNSWCKLTCHSNSSFEYMSALSILRKMCMQYTILL